MSKQQTKPISLLQQLLFIIASAIPFWLGIYWVLPQLLSTGYSTFNAFLIGLFIPLLLLLVAAIVYGFKKERHHKYKSFFSFWGLKPLKAKDWLWILLLFAIMVISYLSLGGTSNWVANNIPGFAPTKAFNSIQTTGTFFGITLKGNWWALLFHIILLLVNIFGEELWFRGVLFQKQFERYGKHTWLVHGISYHIWHMFYPWDVIRLLPISLGYAWVRQKTNNTWTTIIAHFLFNSLGLMTTVSAIMA